MTQAQKISTLWIVIMFNMAFADILGFMLPGMMEKINSGSLEGVTVTPAFLLIAAILIEIGIAMIILTRIASRQTARMLNFIAAPITVIFIIGGGSLAPHYIFFASIETLCLCAVIYQALKWHEHS